MKRPLMQLVMIGLVGWCLGMSLHYIHDGGYRLAEYALADTPLASPDSKVDPLPVPETAPADKIDHAGQSFLTATLYKDGVIRAHLVNMQLPFPTKGDCEAFLQIPKYAAALAESLQRSLGEDGPRKFDIKDTVYQCRTRDEIRAAAGVTS